ncbi:hypothetical protein ACGF1Z_31040 [Streptomyces sp. NPDC048018]|uniref:hypothetical protein n=1 Tax=Streptomyces sp. NPDC048018 TaxID=3365499 RepID=UPI003721E0F2
MTTPDSAPVLRPDCEFGEHTWCKPDEVRTSYGELAVPAHRCDCPCHRPESKATS